MKRLAIFLLLLAGCADPVEPDPTIEVTDDTGGILGVVVDGQIQPVAEATVTVVGQDMETTTAADGTFAFLGLEPGTYFLSVERFLYTPTQASVDVVAGDGNPPITTIQIQRLVGVTPYVEIVPFEGFYECAFATVFITDSCDMAPRTIHDAGVEPVPRSVQNNHNTAYAVFSESIMTVVQEAWWDETATATFRTSLQDTPIDNLCDCSTKHMERAGDGGYILDRMERDNLGDKNTGGSQSWPDMDQLENGQVAIRGFIPFQEGGNVDYAVNLNFQIVTTFFHNHVPHPDWNLEQRDQFPVPE